MKDRKELIEKLLAEGLTTVELSLRLNVSRARVYQLLGRYGLKTPIQAKKSKFDMSDPHTGWFIRTMRSKALKNGELEALQEGLVFPEKCPVLGIPLIYGENGMRTDASATVDRIDNQKYYVPGNIHIISWRANRIKNDSTLEELDKLTAYLHSL